MFLIERSCIPGSLVLSSDFTGVLFSPCPLFRPLVYIFKGTKSILKARVSNYFLLDYVLSWTGGKNMKVA